MANLTRSAKPGSDWSCYDLAAYNIIIHQQPAEDFFGYKPDTIPENIDAKFLTATLPSNNDKLSDATYELLQYIYLVHTTPDYNQEPAAIDAAREVLDLTGYHEQRTLMRSRFPIPFMIDGDTDCIAQADICLLHARDWMILLAIQGGKAVAGNTEIEARVIADGIAAFQYNNDTRDQAGLPRLKSMTIPAITVLGTCPVFYRIQVTQALGDAVAGAQYPAAQTTVFKCVIDSCSGHLDEGMRNPEFRQEILKHYEAFRKMTKECWKGFII